MSYDDYTEQSPSQQVNQDRIIQLLAESDTRPDYFYRTLFGSKALPAVVLNIERMDLLKDIVSPIRSKTIGNILEMYKNVLVSTTSIGGRTLNILNETKTRTTIEDNNENKTGMFG
jgi:hypothetical protein